MTALLDTATIIGGASAVGYFIERSYAPSRSLHERLAIHRGAWGRPNRSFPAVMTTLLQFTLSDQERRGPLAGQFGRRTVRAADDVYTAPSDFGAVKPRLWHTGVVVAELTNLRRSRRVRSALHRANRGVNGALGRSGSIRVAIGAKPAGHPQASGTYSVVSYRHTIRAAHILFTLDPGSIAARTVFEMMLDTDVGMQDGTGGWIQCSAEFTEPDLYGSAYAVRYLHDVISASPSWLTQQAANVAIASARHTLEWIDQLWEETHLAYGGVGAKDNGPLVLAEIGPAAIALGSRIGLKIGHWLLDRLSEFGHPHRELISDRSVAGRAGSAIRVAYAIHRALPNHGYAIQPLVEYAYMHFNEALDSAEAIMALALLATFPPGARLQ